REPLDCLDRAGEERQPLAVALAHPPDDLGADLLGWLAEPDHVVHVARPTRRAHAHPVPLRALAPAAAALARELLADLVPELLGVEEDAVEVEDDGLDHTATKPLSRWTRGRAGAPGSAETTSPTKSVWSPTACAARVSQQSQPSAPSRTGGPGPARPSTPAVTPATPEGNRRMRLRSSSPVGPRRS